MRNRNFLYTLLASVFTSAFDRADKAARSHMYIQGVNPEYRPQRRGKLKGWQKENRRRA